MLLKIRRRRWRDLCTGKSFTLPTAPEMVARGARYSKEFGAFLKETYGDIPVICRTLEDFYHIDRRTFEKQYKEVLRGFREWDQLEHAVLETQQSVIYSNLTMPYQLVTAKIVFFLNDSINLNFINKNNYLIF